MPLFLIPLGIFLSALLTTALVRILAGAGVALVTLKGIDILIESVLSNLDIGSLSSFALIHMARLGIIEGFEIELGAFVFAISIKAFTLIARLSPV